MSLHGVPRAESARRARVRQGSAIRRTRGGKRLTKAERQQLWASHNGRCHICELPVPLERMHVEHKVALANGGADDLENMAPAHSACNLEKGSRQGARRKGLRRKPLRAKPRARTLPDDIF